MANKKKVATTAVALTTAAALLLGGTFAWQSISQRALNEASDVINPGGRLHNDMWYETDDTTNSNIYVENFTDAEKGGDDIYARVRLGEYMEIVMNYGSAAEKVETVAGSKTPLDGSSRTADDATAQNEYDYEYDIHYFDQANATDEYWTWDTDGSDAETTYYMPTFNKNKDSLAPDLNGLYCDRVGGISNRSADQYHTALDDAAVPMPYEVDDVETAYAIYDADTNNVDELTDAGVDAVTLAEYIRDNTGEAAYPNNILQTSEEHTAQPVGTTRGLKSLTDWLTLVGYDTVNDSDENVNYVPAEHGDYWVYDTDGWVYWTGAIGAGETTGLLLDSFTLKDVMDDTWYYAIEAKGEFVTADDLGEYAPAAATFSLRSTDAASPTDLSYYNGGTGFYKNGISKEALALLRIIGVDVDGKGTADGEAKPEAPKTVTVEPVDPDVEKTWPEYNVNIGDTIQVGEDTSLLFTAIYDNETEEELRPEQFELVNKADEVDDENAYRGIILRDEALVGHQVVVVFANTEEDYKNYQAILNVVGIADSGDDSGDDSQNTFETLPDINFSYGEASATVYRGTTYSFGNVADGGFTVYPSAAKVTTEGAASYVDTQMRIVIPANEPKDTLTVDVTYGGDGVESYTSVLTLTVTDRPASGDEEETPSWMPEFTKDDTIVCVTFSQHGAFVSDAEEALYFEGQWSSEDDDVTVANATLTIYDADGKELVCEVNEAGTSDGTIAYMALTNPIEGVQPGDKFYAVATYELDDVTYGNSWMYTWSDLANHVTFIGTVVNEENMFTKSVESVCLFDENGEMFDLKGDNDYDMVVKTAGQEWSGMSAIAAGSMSFVKELSFSGGVIPFTFGVVTGAQYSEEGNMTGYTELVWQSDVYYLYDDAIHTYVQTVKHNGVKYFAMRAVDDNEICLVTPEKMDEFNCCASYSTGMTSVGDINWEKLIENCEHWYGTTPVV